jgi:hypothetical protein
MVVFALSVSAESSCAENELRISRPQGARSAVSKPAADAEQAELRISRPVAIDQAKEGITLERNSADRTGARAFGTPNCAQGNHQTNFGTTGGAMPICSNTESPSGDPTKRLNHKCCDVSSEYFPLTIVGPSQHFGMWLRLNLYPTLCSSVLCQRQCAVNGYESCNALGVERNLIQSVIDSSGGDCSSGGCCEADRPDTTSAERNQQVSRQP